jgi:hypothetical protein
MLLLNSWQIYEEIYGSGIQYFGVAEGICIMHECSITQILVGLFKTETDSN